jgi:hypothetical protein
VLGGGGGGRREVEYIEIVREKERFVWEGCVVGKEGF